MSAYNNTEGFKTKATAALRSFFIGDALSMPVHWFYNPLDIERAFPGGITQMEAAPVFHPSSIMSLHSTSAGGRGAQNNVTGREVVGDVILKDKRKYWGIPNQHYHQGLPAGENTLNAWCARLLMTSVTKRKAYDPGLFTQDYIEFMTADTPQHPDTYAESYHRGFFANLTEGKQPDQCGAVTHDTPSIGGLVTIVPLALFELLRGADTSDVQTTCRQHLHLTHPDETLSRVCDSLVVLIERLLQREESEDPLPLLVQAGKCIPKTRLETLLKKAPGDLHVIGRQYSSACYITDSWPSMLYLAAKYQPDVRAALLANTNAGGENAHRGAVLGSIVGLISAEPANSLYNQLLHKDKISNEIDEFLDLALNSTKLPENR